MTSHSKMKNRLFLLGMIKFYRGLMKQGKIKPEGSSYDRMRILEERFFRLSDDQI